MIPVNRFCSIVAVFSAVTFSAVLTSLAHVSDVSAPDTKEGDALEKKVAKR